MMAKISMISSGSDWSMSPEGRPTIWTVTTNEIDNMPLEKKKELASQKRDFIVSVSFVGFDYDELLKAIEGIEDGKGQGQIPDSKV